MDNEQRARVAAAITWFPASWLLVSSILAVDRGIDLTDEGLYLLDADPPAPTAAWNFPYGWVTAPLFRAVRGDIASFRALGGVLLLSLTTALALEVRRFSKLRRIHDADDGGMHSSAHRSAAEFLTVIALGASGFFFYSELGFLRVPSYNWVNLVGLLTAVLGIFRTARTATVDGLMVQESQRQLVGSAAVIAAGLFIAAHAKPTTPVLLALISGPFLFKEVGRRQAAMTYALTIGFGVGFAILAIALRLWPAGFVSVLLRPLRVPPVETGHGLAAAVMLAAAAPFEAMRVFLTDQPHWLVGPLLISLAAGFLNRRTVDTESGRRRVVPAVLVGLSTAALGVSLIVAPRAVIRVVHEGHLGLISDALMPGRSDRPLAGYVKLLADSIRLTGWLLAAVASGVLVKPLRPPIRARAVSSVLALLGIVSLGVLQQVGVYGAGPAIGFASIGAAIVTAERARTQGVLDPRRAFASGAFLLFGAMGVYAFGHAGGPVEAISAAACFGAAGVYLTATKFGFLSVRTSIMSAAVLMLSIALGNVEVRNNPWRSDPINEQTVPVALGARSVSLSVDRQLAEYLAELRFAADESGWEIGTRLYGLHVTWSSTIPYIMGATPPPSLMPGLNLHTGGLDRIRFDLARQDLASWDSAWLLLPDFRLNPRDGIEPAELAAVRSAVHLFTTKVNTQWPDDYELVWRAPVDAPRSPHTRIELYRPRLRPDSGGDQIDDRRDSEY